MPDSRNLHIPIVVALCLTVGCASSETFNQQGLERAEDLSESLANDMLAFSVAVRDGDYESVASYVADRVEATPLPQTPPSLEPLTKWIRHRQWSIPGGATALDREAFLESFRATFGRFSEIEDARFKIKSASFDEEAGDRGEAQIKFFVVGREDEGRREWLKGTGHIEVEKPAEGPWRIRTFHVEKLESKVSDVDLFSEVAVPAGVSTVFPGLGERGNEGFIHHGAATADVNDDGLLDIAGTGVGENYLYINEGAGTFKDASADSLVKFAPEGSGALFLDYDNDGDSDLFFAAVGSQVLLENRWIPDGEVEFWDVTEQSGVNRSAIGFSAVSADVNGDGYPDIYVCSYNRYGDVMPNSWYEATNGTPNLLFINQKDGTFREASAEWGVQDSRWSYAAGFLDIDGDGDQDLYVANDFGVNGLYRNDGDRFSDIAEEAGLRDPGFGMGVSFGDYDNDGDFDLHVTNMSSTAGNRILALLYPEDHEIRRTLAKQAAGNSLYENQGDGTFREITADVGGLAGGWAWGGGFLDFDNDGWEDLYTPNGFVSGKSMKDT